MSAGWTCPTCKRGVAPHVQTCDHGGTIDAKGRDFVPIDEFYRLERLRDREAIRDARTRVID